MPSHQIPILCLLHLNVASLCELISDYCHCNSEQCPPVVTTGLPLQSASWYQRHAVAAVFPSAFKDISVSIVI